MHLEVDRSDYRRCRIRAADPPSELDEGLVLLHVERVALTANNISYAVAGDELDYWGFFPAEEPWGRVPAMGIGRVNRSSHPGISAGQRFFGFFPTGTHLVVDPEPRPGGFVDTVSHRRGHAGAYRTYSAVDDDPFYADDRADRTLLLRGLFLTSFLADDSLAEQQFGGATTVIVTSASSKTSIALAHRLRERTGVTSVGLTSPANHGFVERVGYYDQVLDYDSVAALPRETSVVVDVAGNHTVLAEVHEALGPHLVQSMQIGATHWDSPRDARTVPGPTPEFFFAPAQMAKRNADWGHDGFRQRVDGALVEFLDDSERWLTVDHRHGAAGLEASYLELVAGRVPPDHGLIVSPLG